MIRLLPIAGLLLASATAVAAAPVPSQARQCSLDSMSPAEKQALSAGYYKVAREAGQARAEAWVKAQASAFAKKLIAEGVCPPPAATRNDSPASPEPAEGDEPLRNRHGKPCKRIEMENQNVPNLGGAMGWALIPVCKDQ
ncbi:hypothetical protein E5A73_03635 [Sphingomonas gei]|uniref:Uncharacterized protein n=1 Tax=Sphingomonas gei TaxID=1395960 RepID=A0A4S1XLS8_9SPHN|nr:hypothetical protein [Sphingomonas gei]TGX56196.1 hypothetical protein E5A73_03635 [Sphingomonas gei]